MRASRGLSTRPPSPSAGRCVRRHRRFDARPVHRRRAQTRAPRDCTHAPPDGQLIEHVRASSRFLAACQDNLLRKRGALRRRLHLQPPDRGADARLRLRSRSDGVVWRGMPAIVHPLRVGRATRDLDGREFVGGLEDTPNANHRRKEAGNAAADAAPRGCRVDSTGSTSSCRQRQLS